MRLQVPEVLDIHLRLVRARALGRPSGLLDALEEAWRAGARAEAECRKEDRAAAAVEVCELVDGFGQWSELVDADQAHFAGLAAEVCFAGTPLRRRLGLAWRLLRPRRRWRAYGLWWVRRKGQG